MSESLPFGPVQLLVLEFERTRFDGEIMPELERLKEAGIIRLVDLLFVTKREGKVETMQASDLSEDEAEALGSVIGALIGAGAGEDDLGASMAAGAAELADGHLLDEDDVWYFTDAIPDGTSAAVALIEHRWAIPLRDKILASDGVLLVDEWIHPSDLLAVGAVASALVDEDRL